MNFLHFKSKCDKFFFKLLEKKNFSSIRGRHKASLLHILHCQFLEMIHGIYVYI